MEIETEATEVGGRAAAKENVDPVANQGAISPNIETRVENELPVTVALMVRPLVGGELVDGCRECVTVHANEPSVSLVSEHKFTYDHVYHGSGLPRRRCTRSASNPWSGLLGGYNATVLAYGQTGSGKTFTMGTGARRGAFRVGNVFARASRRDSARHAHVARARRGASRRHFRFYQGGIHRDPQGGDPRPVAPKSGFPSRRARRRDARRRAREEVRTIEEMATTLRRRVERAPPRRPA